MLELSQWPYIQITSLSGNLQADFASFLTTNGKEHTASHCMAVAKTSARIAVRFGIDEEKASVAAFLHDVSNVMWPQDMLHFAIGQNWEIDAAEKQHPFLLHQRMSAVFAKAVFGVIDPLILSAIGCHTTLKENPSVYDMTLFLADKLSWDQSGTPPFFDAVSAALEESLTCACAVYINYVLDNGMILSPHKWLMEAKRWLESAV